VVEATSGNTGIGLAMVCAQKGYPLVVTMADSFSIERRKLMRIPRRQGRADAARAKGFGMYQKAVELAEANGWFLARQFETPANAEIHEARRRARCSPTSRASGSTGWVTGYGTGGTITGVGRVLRKERPDTKIVLCEPAERPAARQRQGAGAHRRRRARRQPSAFSRIRSRAGRPTSSRYVLQEAVDKNYYDELRPDRRGRGRSKWARALPQRRASSPASPAARPSPRRCRSPSARRKDR
jgi:cysteine synthase A